MGTVTAVILSYNKAWIFSAFLRSLQSQIRPADEVIVVDDASSDDMSPWLDRLPAAWKLIKLHVNRGQSYARNAGAAVATSDYVIFLDGDIEMEPDMLKLMAEALDSNPGASIAYGHYNRRGSRVGLIKAKLWDADALREANYVSMMSMVRLADLPSPVCDASLRRCEDWDLWIRMADASKTGIFIDRVLFVANYQPTDLSGVNESYYWYLKVRQKHGIR